MSRDPDRRRRPTATELVLAAFCREYLRLRARRRRARATAAARRAERLERAARLIVAAFERDHGPPPELPDPDSAAVAEGGAL